MRPLMCLVAVVAFAMVGCAKQVKVKSLPMAVKSEPTPEPRVEAPKPPTVVAAKPVKIDEPSEPMPKELKKVYFGYNRYTLSETAKEKLQKHSSWLHRHKNVRIQIAGHCDKRGSVEYNLLLGERRAHAIKQFLMHMGVPSSRLSTISFGHQKPADNGETREAFAKNRRGEFEVIAE